MFRIAVRIVTTMTLEASPRGKLAPPDGEIWPAPNGDVVVWRAAGGRHD